MYKTLIVVDNDEVCLNDNLPDIVSADVIGFDTYLNDYPKLNESKTRIINLCDTHQYLSRGYYCSLLSEARQHTILPSVKTINELRQLSIDEESIISFKNDVAVLSQQAFPQDYKIYFGKAEVPALQKLADRIFNLYPAPILNIRFFDMNESSRINVERFAFSALNETQRKKFIEHLSAFTQTVWRMRKRPKKYRWDMAILVNPSERVPPSNKEALSRFVKAAAKHSIHAECVTIDQVQNISQYDALFIRETTAIDHHTYRLASKAENSGVVVIDDPASILRCCNKVYLHDAFNYQKVPSLKTEVISNCNEDSMTNLEAIFTYPLVLKMPEGSFSKGVYKVKNRQELQQKWQELSQESALILAQEYLYTEFDWRIGVLNGRAVYACRYLMARNHWQIYNHNGKRITSGGFETLPTFEAPKTVLDAALKAAKIIGNGLYGVDIKHHNNHAYVLEVNDNPSIDHKVEDAYLGNELYMQIMGEFQGRLETRGR